MRDPKRIKPLKGFPVERKFETKEEVDAYFSTDKIQCLLCGRWYNQIGGLHLDRMHGVTPDDYREMYGLPWTRGLTGRLRHDRLSKMGKKHWADGKLSHVFENFRKSDPNARPHSPPQPFLRDLNKKHALISFKLFNDV